VTAESGMRLVFPVLCADGGYGALVGRGCLLGWSVLGDRESAHLLHTLDIQMPPLDNDMLVAKFAPFGLQLRVFDDDVSMFPDDRCYQA